MRQCPYCGEQIENTNAKCPFCGSNVEPQADMISVQNNPSPDGPKNTLSNGFKVFITMVSVIPLIGQLVGIIMAIIYMNNEGDTDKKSFGKALLIGTLVIFLVLCICCIGYMAFGMYAIEQMGPELFEQFE